MISAYPNVNKTNITLHQTLLSLNQNFLQVFARQIQGNPEISRKLSVIPGDLSRPQLGLSREHVAVISQNVQIIFHSAATLR